MVALALEEVVEVVLNFFEVYAEVEEGIYMEDFLEGFYDFHIYIILA